MLFLNVIKCYHDFPKLFNLLTQYPNRESIFQKVRRYDFGKNQPEVLFLEVKVSSSIDTFVILSAFSYFQHYIELE